MIITIVTDVLGSENNGTTITCKRLIENLKMRGHTVRVVCPSSDEKNGYYTVGKTSFGILDNYVEKNGVELAKVDYDILKEAITGADVVHILLPFRLGKAAIKVCKELKVPYTSACHAQAQNITSHLGLMKVKKANKLTYKALYEYFYKEVKFVHCPSEFIANELRDNGYKMDLRVIPNGVSPQYKRIESVKPQEIADKFCILFVGRFSKEKRHDVLIKAVKKSKYKDSIQLIFAGNGPLEDKVRRMGKKLKNPPIMKFCKVDELVEIISYCDLYVHPSDYEIEAISCLEAITCGLVPIISDSKKSATNHFALHESNLFKAGDSLDLAKKIDYFIEHKEVIEKQSREYMEYAKQYEISKCIDKMEKMFNDAIEEYKGEKAQCQENRSTEK